MGTVLPDSAAPPGQTPPEGLFIFQDSHGSAYRETLRRYTDMAPFSYDAASDPAYQAYKKQYAREGARSAENTLGQYAAMTGGVPSTAAVTAAQHPLPRPPCISSRGVLKYGITPDS